MTAALVIPKFGPQAFKDEILEKFGNLDDDDLEVWNHHVIVAKYIRTSVGRSGIIMASKQTQTEDKWQGKVGLVLKVGPGAFEDDGAFRFHGVKAKRGDWVIYRYSDGWDQDLNGITWDGEPLHLRWLEDAHIKGRTKNPDLIW